MLNSEPPRVLTLLEANARSRVGQHTLRKAVRDGDLAAIRLGKRRILIRVESLDAYLVTLEGKATK